VTTSTLTSPVLERFYELVDEHPDKIALIYAPEQGDEIAVTWREFDRASTRIARMFESEFGVNEQSMVVAATRNSHWHYFVTYAAWKLGALAMPLRAELPARERDEILDLANPAVVYADWDDVAYPVLRPDELSQADEYSDERLPNIHPHPGKAISSGGSTGHSKLIIDRTWDPSVWRRTLGMEDRQVQLMAAPLYHNSPALIGNSGLMKDHTLVIMQRFTPEQAVDLIERHHVSYAYLPPIILQRIARMPGVEERDLSSIEAFHSSAAVCPPWLKQWWIDHIGAEKVWEVYGSSEGVGATIIRGDEWLEHPGSVGRPSDATKLRILDEDQHELPPGEVGEIYMWSERGPTFEYVGAPPLKSTPDGFYSIGDLGSVDEDGYLYIADRRTDMIVTGGANVFPAEVEAALGEHPEVADVVVVGIPDDEWGRRVHAIVQPRHFEQPPTVEELNAHVRERLVNYKAPKTYEFLHDFPRNEAGKIRRTQLASERETGSDGVWLPATDAPH
jgi:bile acid-coenzyme A ligase